MSRLAAAGSNGYLVLGTGKLQHHGAYYDHRLPETKIHLMYDAFGHPSDYGPFAFDGVEQDSSPAVPSPYRDMGKVDGSGRPELIIFKIFVVPQ